MSAPERAHVGLGSNLGEPASQLASAVQALARLPRSTLVAVSPGYESLPWGDPHQANFLNAVAALDTALTPRQLLGELLRIEREHGRDRSSGRRNGPRTLDLDLLLHGSRVVDEPGLQLPHPRLAERAFVLLPLNDLAPDLAIPGVGPVKSLLRPEFASLCWRADGADTPPR